MADAPAHGPHPIFGWVLIVLGVMFLAGSLLPGFSGWIAPAGLALGGVLLLLLYKGRQERCVSPPLSTVEASSSPGWR
jgi:uncharacterized membrane protein YphA (DoxX/SURF4 family)